MKIGHIINPVKTSEESDLFVAQPVTFESMLKAKRYSKNSDDIIQFAIGYEEDNSIFPRDFVHLKNLDRSILDCGNFEKKRKLPLIGDILKSLESYSDLDYIVYTNVDIALQPYFYDFIFDYFDKNSGSCIINRRVVKELDSYESMYSEVGDSHPGYDCFVFKQDLIKEFNFGNVCIGANWIGRSFYANLIVNSSKVTIFKDRHLTFHIGDDGAWLSHNYNEFDKFNKSEVYSILESFKSTITDAEKKMKLHHLIDFMNSWGSAKPPVNRSFVSRVKSKLIRLIGG